MAKDELKGQTLLCPKCHEPLTIGAGLSARGGTQASGGLADLLDEVGIQEVRGPRCPNCAAGLRPNAVMCVECGFNLQTKERVKAAKVRKAGERGHGEAAEDLLTRAAGRIQEDKAEEKKNRSQGLPAWVYFLMLAGIIAFTIAMFRLPRDQAVKMAGFCVIGAGSLGSTYFSIRILIVAFGESMACGLMCLFIPFYQLFYVITRWDMCGGYFLMSIATSFISGIGAGMLAMAPMFEAKPDTQQSWLPPPTHFAVVAPAENFEVYVL
jgi:hypothetical protein